MARRDILIARSIVFAILTSKDDVKPTRNPSCLKRFLRFFYIYWLTFRPVQPDLFKALRGVWQIKEEDYRDSFDIRKQKLRDRKEKRALIPMGDMGYSGSTFYHTSDNCFLVKSIPRPFEHNFFKSDMLLPYADHVRANRSSLLVRITDFLENTHQSIGVMLGVTPSHHIIMENILYGKPQEAQGSSNPKWESWDLKPSSYFFPERDIAGGALASEATKSKLADEFNDRILLSEAQATQFQRQLENDTLLLANCDAVDYSLFLVRISAEDASEGGSQSPLETGQIGNESIPPAQAPFTPPNPPTWRTGVASSNGKEVYRAAILDFFWAKHTIHAKAMTGLVRSYNLIDDQGPMSITADSKEYRDRFLNMCMELVEVQE
ncbi:SAICAR synthase-like protein [Annulohypoxylon maeteangense]|uniref:SAICAR synthase-like protein n=1 Tax=Annulohypoxylon maeteangense TaxID=1927788 RepID=UPI0020073F66|nr:SAICAR synthase-like protein [Annulohypoxylon maeteangense]KAI0886871.1 SAICAR synthase-like protein [Annulohypoxylon maeteangense]